MDEGCVGAGDVEEGADFLAGTSHVQGPRKLGNESKVREPEKCL